MIKFNKILIVNDGSTDQVENILEKYSSKNKNIKVINQDNRGVSNARNTGIKNSNAEVNLKETETGISPGQACVFYSKNQLGDKVLGGGWITRAVNKYLST